MDETDRYIEYLQRGALPDGWEQAFDGIAFATWVRTNKGPLAEMAAALHPANPDELLRQHEDRLGKFRPTTRFETPDSDAIFTPLLKEIQEAARRLQVRPVREIRIATSTDISFSPASRPTDGEHLLFIGRGTAAFCNYWAKAYAAIVKAIAAKTVAPVQSPSDLVAIFQREPSGLLVPARLALFHAVYGTVLGFGEVVQPLSHTTYRLELLRAIELFVVGHEFAHFVAEERLPHLRGSLELEQQHELERFCDALGLALSRECSGANFLTFCGVGAVVLLRSAELTASVRDVLAKSAAQVSGGSTEARSDSSHPAPALRVAAIKTWVHENTVEDERPHADAFIAEYDRIACAVNTFVLEAVQSALAGP